jgi:hypothetical protein
MRSEIAQSDQRLRAVAWLLRYVRFPITPTAAIPNDEKTNLTIAPVPRLRDGGSVCHRAPLSLARICGRHVGGRVRLWHHVSDTDERCPSFAASCDTQVALALDSFLSGSRHCLQMQAMAGFFIRGIRMTLPVCELSADDASNSLRAPTALRCGARSHRWNGPRSICGNQSGYGAARCNETDTQWDNACSHHHGKPRRISDLYCRCRFCFEYPPGRPCTRCARNRVRHVLSTGAHDKQPLIRWSYFQCPPRCVAGARAHQNFDLVLKSKGRKNDALKATDIRTHGEGR